jgi:hypothetical protein
MLSQILSNILESAATLHGSGPLSEGSIIALSKRLSRRQIRHSVETGSSASTFVFSHLSDHHLLFSVDSGTGSIENVRKPALLRAIASSSSKGPTQLTLPTYTFTHPLDAVLLDGPHAWPFRDTEYYHLYPHIVPRGMLAIDIIEIPTMRRMLDILRADDMWNLDGAVTNTAFFTRTRVWGSQHDHHSWIAGCSIASWRSPVSGG